MDRLLTLKVDTALLAEAQQELGTTQEAETVQQAPQAAINVRRRQRLADVALPGLTPESLESLLDLRRTRSS